MTAYENTVSLKRGENSEKPGELERRHEEKIAGGKTDEGFEKGYKHYEGEKRHKEDRQSLPLPLHKK